MTAEYNEVLNVPKRHAKLARMCGALYNEHALPHRGFCLEVEPNLSTHEFCCSVFILLRKKTRWLRKAACKIIDMQPL